MGLIDDLKAYARALEKVKTTCLVEALKDDDESAADVAAGQYVAYATCQSAIIDFIREYEGEVDKSA